jgi:hypothetical protein
VTPELLLPKIHAQFAGLTSPVDVVTAHHTDEATILR